MVIDSTVYSNILVTVEKKEHKKKHSTTISAILMIEIRGGDHKYVRQYERLKNGESGRKNFD